MSKRVVVIYAIVAALLLVSLTACERGDDESAESQQSALIQEVRTNVLIVLDTSESMLAYGFLPHVADAIRELVTEMEPWVDFGLMAYPGQECKEDSTAEHICSVPDDPFVEIGGASVTEDIINALASGVDGLGVCGATPTAATLASAKDYLTALDNGQENMVMLITDGAPNCDMEADGAACECTDSNSLVCYQQNFLCLDDAGAKAQAKKLSDDGIPVYVLSIGEAVTPFASVMDDIASSGGTSGALTAEEFQLVQPRMDELQKEMYSCEYDVNWDAAMSVLSETSVDGAADKIILISDEKISNEEKISEETKISYCSPCGANEIGFTVIEPDGKISTVSKISKESKISLTAGACNLLKESKISKISKISLNGEISAISRESKISNTAP